MTGKSILVTGGTGSFGKAFIKHILEHHAPSRVVVYSRDELKQYEFRSECGNPDPMRWFIGDVRDAGRLERAMQGIDVVVHAAALKQVDTAEYNPFECIATNVLGAENVINAAIDAGVEKLIALSTDKASSPINLYGASKLCSDKLFVAGNHYSGSQGTKFSVVRYGNVMGSRGSVIPLFKRLASSGEIPITDPRMTRFWITLPQAVDFVVSSFDQMQGGEIFVPKIPSTKILDIAEAIAPGVPIRVVGIRPGEKLHEEMVSEDDARRTFATPDRFVVTPVIQEWGKPTWSEVGSPLPDGFAYRSNTNDRWLSVDEIRRLVADFT
ncbi:MAG: UDP-N-acetylglucosamine 4,6-dehydratase (inverting) [Actinobacteria bacterium]|nr:UDP-N-acetylglucosamine 4,6-dehydratase (inverting) [Actinomycetota bacterium]